MITAIRVRSTFAASAKWILLRRSARIAALRDWLMFFVEFLDAKHGMADALNTLMGSPEDLYSKTPDRLASPITALVNNAVEKGAFENDIEPLDLLRALSGVATIRVSENWKRSAVQMVDLLLAGMTTKTPGHDD